MYVQVEVAEVVVVVQLLGRVVLAEAEQGMFKDLETKESNQVTKSISEYLEIVTAISKY